MSSPVSACEPRAVVKPAAIQQRLLPRGTLSLESIECSAMCRQAEAVGGDFFDFLALPHGEVGFVIGDVCGKGVSAALMMANLLAMLRTEARHLPVDPASLIATANRLCYEASFAD